MKRLGERESLTSSQVVENVGVHLHALSEELGKIEDVLAIRTNHPNFEEIRKAQKLDYVRQSLEDLSRGLLFLSHHVETHKSLLLQTNELSCLKLQSTKNLFQNDSSASTNQHDAGKVDIF